MGRMESIWTDPETFIPERFLEEITHKSPFAFVPFSAGSRNCIGQKFAMLEMKSVVSKILRNFEVTVAPSYEPILIAEMILRPENGMMLKFQSRKTF